MDTLAMLLGLLAAALFIGAAIYAGLRRGPAATRPPRPLTRRQLRDAARIRAQAIALDLVDQRARRELPDGFRS